jgi:hypothetical protein
MILWLANTSSDIGLESRETKPADAGPASNLWAAAACQRRGHLKGRKRGKGKSLTAQAPVILKPAQFWPAALPSMDSLNALRRARRGAIGKPRRESIVRRVHLDNPNSILEAHSDLIWLM